MICLSSLGCNIHLQLTLDLIGPLLDLSSPHSIHLLNYPVPHHNLPFPLSFDSSTSIHLSDGLRHFLLRLNANLSPFENIRPLIR